LPSRALNSMQKLSALDFDYNEIEKIEDYSFYGLRLSKLNMKGNRLQSIPEHAFVGLEESMQEIDLSENSLRSFPMMALRKLDYLRILRLSNNKISTFYGDIQLVTNNATAASTLRLPSLTFLDLSSNKFTEILDDCFRTFPQLKTLSMYANQIETVQADAFKSLKELMSLDMSHNRIISLDSKIFDKNKRLQTVDLSHNHIHSISGVFSNLPHLREIFLSENNILELPADAFTNSSNVEVIYLEYNAIAHVDPNVFSSLINLDHLYLRANFIPLLPVTLLDKCQKLSSLSLDDNDIQDLEIGMFRKLEFLREVRLHNNRIRRIRKGVFEPLPTLQELHVQKNNIEDIEPGAFQTLYNLQHINLQDNQLTVLEDIFPKDANNSSLLTIQLEANYLNKIHVKTFRRQDKIQIMWLSHNELVRVEKSMFEDQVDLARLYLNHNFIRDIDRDTFAKLKNLKFLDMSWNRMKQLRRDYFAALNNLEELLLSHNFIEAIEGYAFNKMKNLKILDLSHNPLHQITNDVFMEDLALTHLNLKNTSLRKIENNTFKSLQNLNELNLELNYLLPSDIQKLELPGLRTLFLSHNNFTNHIATMASMFDKLRSIQHLTMANCSISALPEDMFNKNTNLVKLDLCDNQLTTMSRNLFNGLNVFKELRLCRNHLMEFPHVALYNLSTLEILDLSHNLFSTIDFYKLSGTLNLRTLNLKENKITSLTGFNAVNLTQLDTVDLSGNHLLSLPANFLRNSINLQKVDLSSNRFLQIPSSALSDISLPRLSWLNLTGNPINTIYTVIEERYPYLKELYICQTNLSILTSYDFKAFKALQHLHLVNNRITRISPGAFTNLTNLLTLDISINELELLPIERLKGLNNLRVLNISHNILRELDEFSSDLVQLQVCDLSFNQLDRISRFTFTHLHNLVELHLMGNRMTVLSVDAFRYLRKLHILDLRKNYFELVPIEALKPLEANIKTLRLEENPLQCSCDAQKLWEWLRDHRKWSSSTTASLTSSSSTSSLSGGSSGDNINYLRCEHPAELRGKIFAKMEPQQFCDAPLIPKIAIQDIQPYSVIVSWQSREHLGLNGYEIVYHAIVGDDEIRGKRLNGSAHSAKLTKLSPNTRYHICVIGTGNWLSEPVATALQRIHVNDSFLMAPRDEPNASMYPFASASSTSYSSSSSSSSLFNTNSMTFGEHPSLAQPQQQQALIENTVATDNALQEVLKNSRFSTCTDVQTLDSTPSVITDENGLATNGFIHSILTRRLGLIVGCCMGIIVFIVMISVLSYVKLKKQRIENAKRQAALPPDYMSYRHFSIPNEELLRTGAAGTVMSSVPSGISAHISGTSLSTSATTTATATTPLGILKVTESLNSSMGGGAATTTTSTGNAVMTGGNGTLISVSQSENGSVAAAAAATVATSSATGTNNHHHMPTNHHNHHNHQHTSQQQQHQHYQQGNGNVVGYMAAGVVLGANHLNNVACWNRTNSIECSYLQLNGTGLCACSAQGLRECSNRTVTPGICVHGGTGHRQQQCHLFRTECDLRRARCAGTEWHEIDNRQCRGFTLNQTNPCHCPKLVQCSSVSRFSCVQVNQSTCRLYDNECELERSRCDGEPATIVDILNCYTFQVNQNQSCYCPALLSCRRNDTTNVCVRNAVGHCQLLANGCDLERRRCVGEVLRPVHSVQCSNMTVNQQRPCFCPKLSSCSKQPQPICVRTRRGCKLFVSECQAEEARCRGEVLETVDPLQCHGFRDEEEKTCSCSKLQTCSSNRTSICIGSSSSNCTLLRNDCELERYKCQNPEVLSLAKIGHVPVPTYLHARGTLQIFVLGIKRDAHF
ncbi:chaoptin-like, partial [Musca vetustissima]|uniref:chaoptin-like n=1 Tax=Musca vetustissima TaxID=27455 RepID=UPI002AB608D6